MFDAMEGPAIPNPFIGSPLASGVPAIPVMPEIGAATPLLLEFELIPLEGAVGSLPIFGFDDRLDGFDCYC